MDKPEVCDTPATGGNSAEIEPEISTSLHTALEDLQATAQLQAGDILVVGASSSEIVGARIGTATSLQIGEAVVSAILAFTDPLGIDVAFQCCEHLNRSLVVEQSVAQAHRLEVVQAVPIPGAGGAVAAAAYFRYQQPCLVAEICGDAGIDIGDTFIGMHLRRVVVPLRGRVKEIGQAHLTMAMTRSPLVGGSRAVYDVTEAQRRIGKA
jgi:uncharacterized protein (TIGR01440 family)